MYNYYNSNMMMNLACINTITKTMINQIYNRSSWVEEHPLNSWVEKHPLINTITKTMINQIYNNLFACTVSTATAPREPRHRQTLLRGLTIHNS